MSAKEYYKHFSSIYGGLTALISSLPIISLVPKTWLRYLFPPMGSFDVFGRVGIIAFFAIITLLVFRSRRLKNIEEQSKQMTILSRLFILAGIGYVSFLFVHTTVVYNFNDYANNETIPISIGFSRSHNLPDTLMQKADVELIQMSGPDDEQIKTVWSPISVAWARVLLLVTYMIFYCSAVALGSFAVLFDFMEVKEKRNKVGSLTPSGSSLKQNQQ